MVRSNFRAGIPLTLIFAYVICVLFYIQSALRAPVVGVYIGKPQDLGLSPRSPFLFHNILHNIFLCSSSFKAYHALIISTHHVATEDHPRAQI